MRNINPEMHQCLHISLQPIMENYRLIEFLIIRPWLEQKLL